MSGGHWEYRDSQISEILQTVGQDGKVIQRFPKLAQVFRDLGEKLGDITHELDWDFSGDSMIEDDRKFELECLEEMAAVLKKKFKFRVYEVEGEERAK